MRKAIHAVARGSLPLVAGMFFSLVGNAQQVPKELQPPANEQLLIQVHAEGFQIYTCTQENGQFLWKLKAPEAKLTDENGKPFGKHFAGPSWEANDGSRVTGKAVANVPSPNPGSIPWLLVTVVSRSGQGVLDPVTSIQRMNTKGGNAPATECKLEQQDREFRAGYSADYAFYAPKRVQIAR